MKPEQALQLIKEALDAAAAQGAFKNLEYINAVIAAYNTIYEKINTDCKGDVQENIN
jgi:hypothetical protein